MKPELMSPAGNREALYAAVENGAEAVYLGLSMFNARKPARNFRFDDIAEVISHAHSKSVKIYITLNIDLKTSELEEAARILELLIGSKADAVIIKDMALIYMLSNYFPPFEYHLSTQFGIANSAAMSMAENLGASRVVLARELNNKEISVLVRPYFPKAEVFVQGSMCFSFSGKCLMSSWFGGRSANRGACQAPCRFRFTREGTEDASSFFSMKDLNLSSRISELSELGVSALKIEGRLKSAEWVAEITKYYRDLLDGTQSKGSDASNFSGREQAEGFYGSVSDLIAVKNFGSVTSENKQPENKTIGQNKYDLKITSGDKIKIEILTDIANTQLEIKMKQLKNENRGISLSELEYRIRDLSFGNLFLGKFILDEDILVAKSQLKNIVSELGSVIAPLSRRESKFLKSIKIPHKLDHVLKNPESDPKNSIPVKFENANIIKINVSDIEQIRDHLRDSGIKKVIVTGVNSEHVERIKELSNRTRVEISLFPILFESELEDIRKIITSLEHTNNISYEANDIGHLKLLKGTSKKIDCGPGLSPYNFLAVKQLKELGLASAHIPLEADIETLDGLKASPLPLRMTIFSKVPLFYTRASSEEFSEGSVFTDREGLRFSVTKFNDISVFTSEEYFSALGTDLSFLKVHEIIIDLSDESDIITKFEMIKKDASKFPGISFNLNRRLQ
ncbi:MAG: U32 family peptidase [Candidatus Delongbacteria bacterium]|nr:U32 family peptidase [Candidatus Delongbacteria bacterium]